MNGISQAELTEENVNNVCKKLTLTTSILRVGVLAVKPPLDVPSIWSI
jgi:hypothetical protein